MAYSEALADRIREVLFRFELQDVEEKKMFGSLAFMVNGKMCVTSGPGRMMCRIDPKEHDAALEKPGCTPMSMRGRSHRGYVYIDEQHLQDRNELERWIKQALDFNASLKDA